MSASYFQAYLLPGAAPVIGKIARAPRDTVAGCDAFAASDLARLAITDTKSARRKLRHGATKWQQRAELLRRLQTSFSKREALDEAERAYAADRLVKRGKEIGHVWI